MRLARPNASTSRSARKLSDASQFALSLVQNLECFAHPGFIRDILIGQLLASLSAVWPTVG